MLTQFQASSAPSLFVSSGVRQSCTCHAFVFLLTSSLSSTQTELAPSHTTASTYEVSSPLLWITFTSLFFAIAASLKFVSLKRSLRKAERLTVAKERRAESVNDYLLQGVQGLILTFHVAAETITEEHPSRQLLDRALLTADELIVVGRQRCMNVSSGDAPKSD